MTERVFQPLARQASTVDQVTTELRRSILRGALAPGQRFSVAGLAREMGISHIPVREALRRLEGQGLIELTHARSASVIPLSADDVRGIYGLRRMIEPTLAARCATLRTDAQVDALAAMITTLRGGDPDAAWQAHQRFHLALIQPAASPWDLRTLDQLWAAAERYTRLVFDFDQIAPTERSRRVRVHTTILDAVRNRSAEDTRAALDHHLAENEEELIARIEDLDRPPSGSGEVRERTAPHP